MKRGTVALTALAGVLLLPRTARADGKAFRGDWGAMIPIVQDSQHAVIVHGAGVEKLAIAISLSLEEQENALWVFPVPGPPKQVQIDVLDSFPQFSGENPRETAREAVEALISAMRTSQLYPLLFAVLKPVRMAAGAAASQAALEVHEQMEKWGVHAETVTADSVNALAAYLREKKLGIPHGELASFEPYLSSDFVLVLVWVASPAELLSKFPEYKGHRRQRGSRWPCLYVEFPTEQAFYPLRPTATYGDVSVPINLCVTGYVRPPAARRPPHDWSWEHYEQHGLPDDCPERLAASLPVGKLRYTRFYFYGKAAELTQDLWFEPYEPPGMLYAEVVMHLLRPLSRSVRLAGSDGGTLLCGSRRFGGAHLRALARLRPSGILEPAQLGWPGRGRTAKST